MDWLLRLATGVALAAAVAALVVRFLPFEPAHWAVDPLTAPVTGLPNSWRVAPPGMPAVAADGEAPVFAAAVSALAAAFDAVALSAPRTRRIAGGPETLKATYVQRSRVIGFPDFVSVRFFALDGGKASLAAYSRARFGGYDWGVNRARIENWLAALGPIAQ